MNIVLILIGHRIESAIKVQSILSENGDIIKTRLGLNRALSQDDQASGFVFLELCGEISRFDQLCKDLNGIEDVKAECVIMDLPEDHCDCDCKK